MICMVICTYTEAISVILNNLEFIELSPIS